MEVFLIAQLIGFVGAVCNVFMFQLRKRSQILNARIAGASFFMVHYWLLGAWTAVGMNVLAIVRTYVFRERTRSKWATSQNWLYLFIALYIIAGVLLWEGWYSIFPVIGMVIGTYGYWNKRPDMMRKLVLFSAPPWIVYDIIVRSYSGLALSLFFIVSTLISIYRHDKSVRFT